jgi:hypothetical protein
MKHVFSVLSVTCVAFFTIFLSTTNVSCKKGDTGPKGDTGNANVIYSDWMSVTFARQVQQPGDTFYRATLTVPKLTDSILNKGDVRVFLNANTAASPNVLTLPYGYSIVPSFAVGKITIDGDDDYSTFTSGGQTYFQYRYVLIQGSTKARSATNQSYEELKAAYNIPD